nr:BCCT family transporter [Halomonas smyrnensis]
MATGLITRLILNSHLGGTDARPDYSYLSWFSMLFAAGMGTSLIFFGVSEPLTHAVDAYNGTSVDNGIRTDWSPLNGAKGNEGSASLLGVAASS